MWEKIKASMGKIGMHMQRFFVGRYGSDALSRTMLFTGLGLYILDLFLRTGLLSLLGIALYAMTLFRMLSKNIQQRATENRKYLAFTQSMRLRFSQAKARFANRKEYKYVRCPNCHSLIRLPRGAGSISVRCKPCNHVFDQRT